jgi:creatinine amidohydrolase/Fe(II)-dependent formamide hydrolase-like protein
MPFAPTGSRERRTGHMRFAGSVSIDTETFQAVMRQVAQSALAAGFKNVFLMGDHGGGQPDALRAAAKDLEDADYKLDEAAHVYYVPDLYFKEKEQMKAYLTEHGIPYDAHAATDDTSEIIFLDEKRWIRRDKLALSTAKEEPTTGVEGIRPRPHPSSQDVYWLEDRQRRESDSRATGAEEVISEIRPLNPLNRRGSPR